MRIHILFEEKYIFKVNLEQNDIVIATFEKPDKFLTNEVDNYIFLKVPHYTNDNKYLTYTTTLFEKLNHENEFLYNTIYFRLLLPILNVILPIIEKIKSLKGNVSVVLYGGSSFPFITMDYSEGEFGKRFLYRRSWMMNPYIASTLERDYKIEWVAKKSSTFLCFIYHLRRVLLLSKLACSLFVKSFKHTKSSSQINEKSIICFVSLPLQYRHLKDILQVNKKYNIIYLSDNFVFNDVIRVPNLSLKKLVDLRNIVLKSIIPKDEYKINLDNYFSLSFSGKQLNKVSTIVKITYYNNLLRYKSFFNLQPYQNVALCLNNKTMGWDAFLDKEIASILKSRLVTFQYVSMVPMRFPSYKMYDVVSFWNPELSRYYSNEIRPIFLYKLKEIIPIKKISNKNPFVFSLFLQPDHYEQLSLESSYAFVKAINSFHGAVKLVIKPHYRQQNIGDIMSSIESLDAFKNGYVSLCDNNASIQSILSNTDISVGFSSSVLNESIFNGIPVVCLVLNDTINYYVESDYFLRVKAKKIYSLSDIVSMINHRNEINNFFENKNIDDNNSDYTSVMQIIKRFA